MNHQKSLFSINSAVRTSLKMIFANFRLYLLVLLASIVFFVGCQILWRYQTLEWIDTFGPQWKTVREYVVQDLQNTEIKNYTQRKVSTLTYQSGLHYFNMLYKTPKLALLLFLIFCCYYVFLIGYIKLNLNVYDQKRASLDLLYKLYKKVPQIFLVQVISLAASLAVLIFGLGLSFLLLSLKILVASSSFKLWILFYVGIAVGLISVCWAIFIFQRLRFAKYVIIDQDVSIPQAMRISKMITKRSVIHLSFFSLVLIILSVIINLIPLVAIILSTFITEPLLVCVYRQLKQ